MMIATFVRPKQMDEKVDNRSGSGIDDQWDGTDIEPTFPVRHSGTRKSTLISGSEHDNTRGIQTSDRLP